MAALPPEKINYRSIGRGSGGVLKKRKPKFEHDPESPSASSIPTSWETVLHKDNHEKKGFSSCSPRFVLSSASDFKPGPGAYSAVCKDLDAGACVGDRGANAFASREPRLKYQRNGLTAGPGAYDLNVLAKVPAAQVPSAAFVEPSTVNLANCQKRAAPGPGEYTGQEAKFKASGLATRATGAFISDTGADRDRADYMFYPDSPNSKLATRGTPPLPVKAVALQGSRRKLCQEPTRKPASKEEDGMCRERQEFGRKLLDSGWHPTGKQSGENRCVSPGPGTYDPNVDSTKGRVDWGRNGTSNFRSNSPKSKAMADRPLSPGPGRYNNMEAAEVVARIRGKVSFVKSPRFEAYKPRAPGPAYYSPDGNVHHMSFHLNLHDTWF